KLDKEEPKDGAAVQVGTFDFIDEELDDRKHGTLIYSDQINVAFTRGFSAPFKNGSLDRPPRDWHEFLNIVGGKLSLRELGDYWRFVWELAATTPVPYVDAQAIPEHLVKQDQARLVSYDFSVVVDDIRLRKPVELKGNKEGYTCIPLELSKKVY